MSNISNLNFTPATMTSREIGALTGKEHKHVMRDIRVLETQLGMLFEGSVQIWTHPQNGQAYEEFAISKDTCLTLLLGYDAVARMKVVKRWQELEAKQPQARFVSPRESARVTLSDVLAEADLFKVPVHLAQVEAVKEVQKLHGVDFSNYLKLAPAQRNIPWEEESLEPTGLGKCIGLNPIQMNKALEAAGLQVKAAEGWMPTEAGAPYASRHQWVVGGKTGYNWQWRRSVLKLITPN